MRRRISAAALGVATLAVAAAFAAPVAGAEPGGCPGGEGAGWFLAPVALAIPAIDTGNWDDQNGDGWGCARVNKGQTEKHDAGQVGGAWTWKDNSNPLA